MRWVFANCTFQILSPFKGIGVSFEGGAHIRTTDYREIAEDSRLAFRNPDPRVIIGLTHHTIAKLKGNGTYRELQDIKVAYARVYRFIGQVMKPADDITSKYKPPLATQAQLKRCRLVATGYQSLKSYRLI